MVRIIAFLLKFIKLVKTKSPRKFQNNNDANSITLSDEEILAAKEYFFRKATLEVKKFIKSRQYQKISILIFGGDLVKKIKIQCERYRYLRKKVIDVEMGPISKHSITIAPAFYATQADICGPFKAYTLHHKRTAIMLWLIVYCCILTSTTNIKVMDDYSAQIFIQAFIGFSCKVGYPKCMVINEGSQSIKGCDNMRISLTDIKRKLHRDMVVDFVTCPVAGHNYNWTVKRRIKHAKKSLEKTISNQRLKLGRNND